MADDFESFVRVRLSALVRYGFVLSGNPHDAADLAQEALARLSERWTRVHAAGNPEAYVRTTMARLHISWWRRRRREHPVRALPEQGYDDAGIEAATGDGGALWRAVGELPRRQRVVLVLRYFEDMTDDEIAQRLGITRVTVRTQAARALGKLRQIGDLKSSETEQEVTGHAIRG
jgi:RNA polymerase sigma-70 factor (sigma-E family)